MSADVQRPRRGLAGMDGLLSIPRGHLYRALVLLLMCAAVAALSDSFATWSNLLNVMRQASLLFLTAGGVTLVILAGGLDLSVGANVGLCACVAAILLDRTGSTAAGITAGVACGAVVGLLNGLMVTALRLAPFVATYGMLWVLDGLSFVLMGGGTIFGLPRSFRVLGSGYLLGIPVPIYLMAVTLGLGGLVLTRSRLGQEIYAIGANPLAARFSGIPVQRRMLLLYTLCGALAGLAGVVYLARVNSAEAGLGESLLLPAIAAVVIGGTSLFGGIGGLVGTLLGAIMLTLMINALNILGVSSNWHPVVTGAVIFCAVLVDAVSSRGRA